MDRKLLQRSALKIFIYVPQPVVLEQVLTALTV